MSLCLVEDDSIMGESLVDRFTLERIPIVWFRSAAEATPAIAGGRYRLVICDIRLPDMSGDQMYEHLLRQQANLPPFIFLTGYAQLDRAVALLKLGASDYITKPFDLDHLLSQVRYLLGSVPAMAVAEEDIDALGISPAMQHIDALLHRLAPLNNTVLITGETGVGKELVARRLAQLRGAGPFVAINCAAMADGLMESELFGHEKGAFTGSIRTHRGVFERAAGGTLFLDEVGDMPLGMQAKLLRVVQERSVVRVGGEQSIPVDVRLILATHKDLKSCVAQGRFREDLYYRVNVVHIVIPPLRERKEDIVWLARRFLNDCAVEHSAAVRRLHPEAEQALLMHSWPGNVRELRHCLERACIFSQTSILSRADIFYAQGWCGEDAKPMQQRLDSFLSDCERQFLRYCLAEHQGRIAVTAAKLGISRKALWQKMKRLKISKDASNPS